MKFFSLKFLQFCCAEPWEFRGEVFAEVFFCSECPSKTRPKTSWRTSWQTSRKTSPRIAPLRNGNFAQNFALQKPLANHTDLLVLTSFFMTTCDFPHNYFDVNDVIALQHKFGEQLQYNCLGFLNMGFVVGTGQRARNLCLRMDLTMQFKHSI